MSETLPLLSLAVWTPVVGAVLVWLLAGDGRPGRARSLALLVALAEFAITLPRVYRFSTPATAACNSSSGYPG